MTVDIKLDLDERPCGCIFEEQTGQAVRLCRTHDDERRKQLRALLGDLDAALGTDFLGKKED